MKAFAFLNGSKKSQQQRQNQQRKPLSITIETPRSSQEHEPVYSHQIQPSRVQSPAYSTISFFSSKSSSSRTGSGANTPEMYAMDGGSTRTNGTTAKSRPSLTILRPRLSSDGNHHPSSEPPQKSGGRLNIYSRFGFSKSSSQLPQEVPTTPTYPTPPPLPVPALPVTVPVTPNRQYQLLHQQMFPEEATGSTLQPGLTGLQVDLDSPPLIPARPPKVNIEFDHLKEPDLDDPISTSIILQRRRAKSLGYANSGAGQGMTALKIPLPTTTADPTPPLPPSRAETVSEMGLSLELTPTRMRSESNANSMRSRSESNSSRARSESNSSAASSSRQGHGYSSSYRASRVSKTATTGRLDNMWDGFLKEVDEDMSDLCTSLRSTSTTPTRPARIEGDGLYEDNAKVIRTAPSPRSRAASSPIRRGTAKLAPAPPAPVMIDPLPKTPLSAPGSRPDLRTVRSFPSPPMTAPIFTTTTSSGTIAMTTSGRFPNGTFKKSASHDTLSSLPYLNSPGSSFQQSPDPADFQILRARIVQPQQPTFVQSLSPTIPPPLRSLVPSPLPTTKPPSPTPEEERPCSTYSQSSQFSGFSQFSLSQFPSPPSVPLVRPTTDAGTFRMSRIGAGQPAIEAGAQSTGAGRETLPLKFKPIVPSTRVKLSIRPVLFERDENGLPVLSMPLSTPRFASGSAGGGSAQSAYSYASSSSGTSAASGSEPFTPSSYRGTFPPIPMSR